MAKNPERIKEKFRNRVAGASTEYALGVADPAKDWLAAFRESEARMKAETLAALNEGRAVKRAQAVGTEKWKNRAQEVGAARYAASATQAAEAFGAVLNDVLAAGEAARRAADAMPDATPEQREQRMLAAIRASKGYWRAKKGLTR